MTHSCALHSELPVNTRWFPSVVRLSEKGASDKTRISLIPLPIPGSSPKMSLWKIYIVYSDQSNTVNREGTIPKSLMVLKPWMSEPMSFAYQQCFSFDMFNRSTIVSHSYQKIAEGTMVQPGLSWAIKISTVLMYLSLSVSHGHLGYFSPKELGEKNLSLTTLNQ